jgi:hypothetical protein
VVVRTVRGSGCTLTWSDDGATVEKRYDRLWWDFYGQRHQPWLVQSRVGSSFRRSPAPVPVAELLSVDRRRRSLVFRAVDGDALGPKFPYGLAEGDLADLVGLAVACGRYRPRGSVGPRRRFDLERRLRRAVMTGVVAPSVADAVRRQAVDDPPVFVFGHGDITARNVLRSASTAAAVLIDWEWAGWYPRGWDLAFLWFSLIDLPGGRAAVEASVPARDAAWFWRSALLVELLHLSMWGLRPGTAFRPAHERTRDELVERVLGGEPNSPERSEAQPSE